MRTIGAIFVLALVTIALEVYSDAALTTAEVSRPAAPDPATVAIAHGAQTRLDAPKPPGGSLALFGR
jgi:hypothetical protein